MRLKKKLLRRIYMQYGGIPERFAICYDIYSSYFHDIFCGIANIVISSKAVKVWSDITITLLYKVTKWKKNYGSTIVNSKNIEERNVVLKLHWDNKKSDKNYH